MNGPLPDLGDPGYRRRLRLLMGVGVAEAGQMLGVSRESFRAWEAWEEGRKGKPSAEHHRAYGKLLEEWERACA